MLLAVCLFLFISILSIKHWADKRLKLVFADVDFWLNILKMSYKYMKYLVWRKWMCQQCYIILCFVKLDHVHHHHHYIVYNPYFLYLSSGLVEFLGFPWSFRLQFLRTAMSPPTSALHPPLPFSQCSLSYFPCDFWNPHSWASFSLESLSCMSI